MRLTTRAVKLVRRLCARVFRRWPTVSDRRPLPASHGESVVIEGLERRMMLSAGWVAGGTSPPLKALGVALTSPIDGSGAWLDFDAADGLDVAGAAEVQMLSSAQGGLVVEVSVPGVWVDSVSWGQTGFYALTLPGYGYTSEVGGPQLPVVRQLVTAPEGAEIVVELVGESRVVSLAELGVTGSLIPLQGSVEKLPGRLEAAELDLDTSAYATDAFAPAAGVRVTEAGRIDGRRVVLLEIAPVAYNPVAEEVRFFDTLTVNVEFQGGKGTLPGEVAVSPSAAAAAATDKSAGRLLIVAHDSLAGEMSTFVTHKTSMGWTVDLADTSTAGTTAAAIRGYIRSRYADVATRPTAVLLVGDTGQVPHFVGVGSGSPDTDLYYGCMDGGDDWQPEIPVGRFSVTTGAQLAAVVDKTIEYETSPSGEWTHQAAFMAGEDNYDITEGTHEWVIANYMDPLGYTSDRLFMTSEGATTSDVRDAFNDGRVFGIYSGHGSEYSWADGPAFSQADVEGLTNVGMYPFVASFACVTGDYSLGECFAETWLRVADKGAVNVWASSVTSYWTEDDILEKRLFEAIYDDGYSQFGSATMRAKEQYLLHFGATDTTRRYFEMYNLFGDPTVSLVGLAMGITSPSQLPLAYEGEAYEYTLTAANGDEPYAWSLTGGSLPAGLSLEEGTGRIHGTPTGGGSSFTIQVTDAAMETDARELVLQVVSRLEITTPAQLPTAYLDVPYLVVLASQGGSTPYSWSVAGGGYEESYPGGGYIGGGTGMGWQADDDSWNLALPWAFPFYGVDYESVHVCSNGFLDFASSSDEYSNSESELLSNVRIAGLWDDLKTDEAGEDIYLAQGGDWVAVRWDAETYEDSLPIDFEIVLYQDGRIRFNYGQANDALTPTIGLSAGDGTRYTMSSYNDAGSIPADVSSLFRHAGALAAGLSLNGETGEISGTPTATGVYNLTIQLADSGTPGQSVQEELTLEVSGLPAVSVALGGPATEGDGLLAGRGILRVPAPVDADLPVTLSCDDTSEVSLPLTAIVIPANQALVAFDIRIEDDSILDGTQMAVVTASADGYHDGRGAIRIHDNETAVLTVTVPAAAREGDPPLVGQATVTVGTAPDDDVEVALSSDDITEAKPNPATVVIPAGQLSASFDIVIVDDAEIDGVRSATIAAHVENWTDGADTIEIADDDARISIQLPAKVWEGRGTLAGAGTVEIEGVLGEDLEVTLVSDDPDELSVSASVVIPAGSTSAPFDLVVGDDSDYDGAQTVTVSATAAGMTAGSDAANVGDDEVHHFVFVDVATPQRTDVPFTVTLIAKDLNDDTIEVYDGAIDVTGTGDAGAVPVEINPPARGGESAAVASAPPKIDGGTGAKGLGVYHDYASMTAELGAYASAYPEICRLSSIGQSVQGRDLWAIQITDNPDVEEAEPEVKYVSTMHGDEPVGTEMCLYFIDYLLSGYGTDARVTDFVDATEIWIVPLMNPDGLEASAHENANSVNLNRDFPEGSGGGMGNVFDGPAMDTSGRQAETVNVMEWSAAHSFVLSANFHTGSLVVNYPYDNDGLGSVDSPTPDDALFEHVAQAYSSQNLPMWNSPTFFHGITNGAAWYAISGGMQDWNYRYLGCNEVTIELSDTSIPPESALPDYWADNQEAMISYLETVHRGVFGVITDAATGEPVHAKVEVAGNAQPVFSDADVGDYHRMLLPGTYDLTFSAPGYTPAVVTGVTVTDTAPRLVDVEMTPAEGRVVFVNGRWTGQVAIGEADTNVILTADDGHRHTGQSNPFDVVNAQLDHFEWSEVGGPSGQVAVDGPFEVTITAIDSEGLVIEDFDAALSLSGSGGDAGVTIGSGTASWEYPMRTYWHDSRTQVIYQSGEIGEASTITGLALDMVTAPGQVLNNWTIRMRHTPLGSYSSESWQADGWTTVYQSNESVTSAGWVDFVFSTPFEYNGFDNLMIDFSHNNSSYSEDGQCRSTDTGETRAIYYYTDSDYGDPLTWSGTTPTPHSGTTVPNIRLRTGSGVPITPTVTGSFTGGVWTGSITVHEETQGMFLRVDDGSGHVAQSNAFDVVGVGLDHFEWSEVGGPTHMVLVDEPFDVTVTAVDARGLRVTDFNDTVALSSSTGADVTVGTGASSWVYPMDTYYEDCRTQVIYLSDEIGGAWPIIGLALDITAMPGQVLGNWTIRMMHTTLSSYSTESWESAGWTTVYQNGESVTSTGWVAFELSTPFDYNGVDNLMVDFSYNNSSFSSDGQCRYTDTGQTRTIYYYCDSEDGDPLTWSDTTPSPYSSTNVPNIRLRVGTDVAITPTVSGHFVAGVWTGSVTVTEETDGMYVRVDDGGGHTGQSNAFDVVAPGLNHFQLSEVGGSTGRVIVDWPFDVTVTAVDAVGATMDDFTGTVSLAGSTGTGGEVIVGTGASSWEYPMYSLWHDSRTQVIYTSDEIGGAALITALALDVTTVPGQVLNNWTIRMMHTSLDSYATEWWETSGWTTVHQNDESVTATGWVDFAFATPFDYNGVDNLMIDFSFNNDSYSDYGECRATDTGESRALYWYADSDEGDPLAWSGTTPLAFSSTNVPNIRLTADSEVTVTPTVSGSFVDGVWTGAITVWEVADNVYLSVDDGGGHTGRSNPFDVVPGGLDHFEWTEVGAAGGEVGVDVPFDVTVTAVDATGATVETFTGAASLSGSAGIVEVIVGAGTASWEYPLSTYYEDCRTQVIYTSGEIGGALPITALALDVTTAPGQVLGNWTIRMMHTALSSYSTESWESAGWTTVYLNDESVTSTGWVDFMFATPFDYNGVDNLMIDFSYNNDDYSEDGWCRYTDTGQTRTLYYYCDSEDGDPLTWSGTTPTPQASTSVPNIRLRADNVVAIVPTVTGSFVAGVWTGPITVREEALAMYLRADDGSGHTGQSGTFAAVVQTWPTIRVTDSSSDPDDASIRFCTALTELRSAASDSDLVRPACPDDGQYFDVTNTGSATLTLFEIRINAPDVSVDIPLTADPADDIDLPTGQTRRFRLTYKPSLPTLGDPTVQSFDLPDGLVIVSNATKAQDFEIALRGKSTFDSDINYDGMVNLAELGLLNVNFGRTWDDPDFDPSADINGDGVVNLSDLGPLNVEFGRQQSLSSPSAPGKAASPKSAAAAAGGELDPPAAVDLVEPDVSLLYAAAACAMHHVPGPLVPTAHRRRHVDDLTCWLPRDDSGGAGDSWVAATHRAGQAPPLNRAWRPTLTGGTQALLAAGLARRVLLQLPLLLPLAEDPHSRQSQ